MPVLQLLLLPYGGGVDVPPLPCSLPHRQQGSDRGPGNSVNHVRRRDLRRTFVNFVNFVLDSA